MWVPFEKWLPDLPDLPGSLVECKNLIPMNGRFTPFFGFADTSSNACAGTPRRLLSAANTSGNHRQFLVTSTNVYRMDGLASSLASIGTLAGAMGYWDDTLYGETLILAAKGQYPQKITPITTGTLAGLADATGNPELGGKAPKAGCCCIYKDCLFLGNVAYNGQSHPRRLFRSAMGNIESWTPNPNNGCGFHDLPDFGGAIVALAPLGDSLIVYTTNAVWQVDFLGEPWWFSYRRIDRSPAPHSPGAVAVVDSSTHYFLTRDGVYALTPAGVRFVSEGLSILGTTDGGHWASVNSFTDFEAGLIFWSGTLREGLSHPHTLIAFNFREGRFSKIIGDDATHNDVPVVIGEFKYSDNGIRLFGAANELTNKVCVYDDALMPLAGLIKSAEVDFGQTASIWRCRPKITRLITPSVSGSPTVSVGLHMRRDEQDDYASPVAGTMNAQGLVNFRANGRFAQVEVTIEGRHGGISGVELVETPAGGR